MTQYDAEVERQRQFLAALEWSKKVKYIYASNGIIETAYNSGDIHYKETKKNGKEKWERVNLSDDDLIRYHGRSMADSKLESEWE